jgi:hypothetical protein
MPEFPIKDRGEDLEEPWVLSEAGAAKQAKGSPDESEIASFESGGHEVRLMVGRRFS